MCCFYGEFNCAFYDDVRDDGHCAIKCVCVVFPIAMFLDWPWLNQWLLYISFVATYADDHVTKPTEVDDISFAWLLIGN